MRPRRRGFCCDAVPLAIGSASSATEDAPQRRRRRPEQCRRRQHEKVHIDDGRQVEVFEESHEEVDGDERRRGAEGEEHRLAEADLLAATGGEAPVGAAVDRYRRLF